MIAIESESKDVEVVSVRSRLALDDIDALANLAARHQPAALEPFAQRSGRLMEHARKVLEKRRAAAELQQVRDEAAASAGCVDKIRRNFPHVAASCQISAGKRPRKSTDDAGDNSTLSKGIALA
jgi:hypothetical protein